MECNFQNFINDNMNYIFNNIFSTDMESEERSQILKQFFNELDRAVIENGHFYSVQKIYITLSIKHNNEQISKLLRTGILSDDEFEKIKLLICNQEKLIKEFIQNKWDLSDLEDISIDSKEKSVEEYLNNIILHSQILHDYNLIFEMCKKISKKYQKDDCVQCCEVIDRLKESLEAAAEKGLSIKINNFNLNVVCENSYIVAIDKVKELRLSLIEYVSICEDSKTIADKPELWKVFKARCADFERSMRDNTKKDFKFFSLVYVDIKYYIDQINTYEKIKLEVNNLLRNIKEIRLLSNKSAKNLISNSTYSKLEKYVSVYQRYCILKDTCKQKEWIVPKVVNCDDEDTIKTVANNANSKLVQVNRIVQVKKNIKIVTSIAVVIFFLVVAGWSINKYNHPIFPIDINDSLGKCPDELIEQLQSCGFANVLTEIDTDVEGYQPGNIVTDIIVDGWNGSANQRIYRKKLITIRITDPNRRELTQYIEKWRSDTKDALEKKLEKAGFTNITCIAEPTHEINKSGCISKVTINKMEYLDGQCYICYNDRIELKYYKLSVQLPFEGDEVIGKNCQSLVQELEKLGFTSISTTSISTGWIESNSVISFQINQKSNFNKGDECYVDDPIEIVYSEGNRINVTSCFEMWEQKDVYELWDSLEEKGVYEVIIHPVAASLEDSENTVSKIEISGEEFTGGNCYISESATVDLYYKVVPICIEEDAQTFVDRKKTSVIEDLKRKGFTNISIKEVKMSLGDFFSGQYNKVAYIQIDGNDEFTEAEYYDFDVEIVIGVYSFKLW